MKKRKLLLAAVSLLAVIVLATTGTFAWLSKEQPADTVYTALSDFEVQGILSFGGTVYNGTDIMIPVSFNPTADNYIGKMKYVVQYQGTSPAYLRVKVLEQWVDTATNEIMSASYLNYYLSKEVGKVNPDEGAVEYPAAGEGEDSSILAEQGVWVDNRSVDYCYYYSVPVQPKMIQMKGVQSAITGVLDGTVQLTLIDQTAQEANTATMIEGIDPATTELMLLFEVEAVQPNRYREFFGIDALPVSAGK